MEYGADGAIVNGIERKKIYILSFFLWLKQKHKCKGTKLNKNGLKFF